jgi:hypothetical protein
MAFAQPEHAHVIVKCGRRHAGGGGKQAADAAQHFLIAGQALLDQSCTASGARLEIGLERLLGAGPRMAPRIGGEGQRKHQHHERQPEVEPGRARNRRGGLEGGCRTHVGQRACDARPDCGEMEEV